MWRFVFCREPPFTAKVFPVTRWLRAEGVVEKRTRTDAVGAVNTFVIASQAHITGRIGVRGSRALT